ncbi:MAG TPA: TonB-dependent receptor [Niabella sp.]|nr:TonB-dependent receptor [Niabella sp.]HOZ98207.1 TonB-dependent receptor [Niabella sp.]HQW16248.1 TonB-dependent receptor [Niabella sp.]HQX21465.1 TonB-dependent receptor [Niabella sp.]HQX42517.1 TonB-dependent receptor [Niabella sp.]
MKKLDILFVLVMMAQLSYAQGISGVVLSKDAKPLPNASVLLIDATDSSFVKEGVANYKGGFRFSDISSGDYLLTVSSIGYNSVYTNVFHYDTTKSTEHTVVLEKKEKELTGVTVTAKKPPVVVKAGITLINVDASPTNAGLNVLELLEKSPGVEVDQEGNVSLKGKLGVLILIDGKPTYMSSGQLATYLKSMQSSGLDQIEIMTTPPAKYDAAGNAGVINIKTKKGMAKGLNGSASAGYEQGYYPRWNGAFNLNYHRGKFNFFGGFTGVHFDGKGQMNINRKLTEPGTKEFLGTSVQETNRRSFGNYNNMKMGVDYTFSDKDILGVVVSGNLGKWNEKQHGFSDVFDETNAFDYQLLSSGKNSRRFSNILSNLNYVHKFDSAGRELSVDLDQAYYDNSGSSNLKTSIQNQSGTQIGNTVLLKGNSPSEIFIYSAKADYSQMIAKSWKWGAGIKLSTVSTDNRVQYERDNGSGWIEDLSRTNHFVYKENIQAAYSTLSTTIQKWELSGGLRLENTSSKGDQKTMHEIFKRNYTNLFPTVGVTYNVNDHHQLALSYSRRITRPDYDNLNPFIFFLDSLTFGKGNPYLKPQFTNNVEMSHTFNRFLTTTFNYTVTSDIITQLLKQEGAITFQTNENFSKMKQIGLATSANFPLTKWWRLNLYGNVFNNHYKGLYNDGINNYPLSQSITAFTGNLTSMVSFAKHWSYELSGWYASRNNEGLIVINPMGAVNTALSRQLFNKKATLKIGVRDVFATQQFGGYARYAIVDTDIKNIRDSRRFNITFTYRFGKQNNAPDRRRSSSSDEEKSRVNSGGN